MLKVKTPSWMDRACHVLKDNSHTDILRPIKPCFIVNYNISFNSFRKKNVKNSLVFYSTYYEAPGISQDANPLSLLLFPTSKVGTETCHIVLI